MMGTAMTPLSTAAQNSARMGLIHEKSRATPPSVASARVAPCDLLEGLAEAEDRADARTEHGKEHGKVLRRQCEMRRDRASRNLAPRDMDGKDEPDIRKQRQREPREVTHIALIRQENL